MVESPSQPSSSIERHPFAEERQTTPFQAYVQADTRDNTP